MNLYIIHKIQDVSIASCQDSPNTFFPIPPLALLNLFSAYSFFGFDVIRNERSMINVLRGQRKMS